MSLQGKNNQRNDQWYGTLYQSEIDIAKKVYEQTIPYDRIFISNIDSPTGAITIATSSSPATANYLLLWNAAYSVNISGNADLTNTFIHELTHVWQSQVGSHAMAYIAEAAWAQVKNGIKDIFKDGYGKGLEKIRDMLDRDIVDKWNAHRSTAYSFKMSEIGKKFNEFNAEQQATVVETWFRTDDRVLGSERMIGGFRSPKDSRFPYIRDCIRAKNPNAQYISTGNPRGYDAEIARIQAVLFNLNYIKLEKQIDGYTGNITTAAVIAFQKNNGLAPDGDLGGVNSSTRRKLNLPISQLKGI